MSPRSARRRKAAARCAIRCSRKGGAAWRASCASAINLGLVVGHAGAHQLVQADGVEQTGRHALREGLAHPGQHRHAGPAPRRRWCGRCGARRRGRGRRRPGARCCYCSSGSMGTNASRAGSTPRSRAAASSTACTLVFQRSSHRVASGTACRMRHQLSNTAAGSCTTGGRPPAAGHAPARPVGAAARRGRPTLGVVGLVAQRHLRQLLAEVRGVVSGVVTGSPMK